MAEILKVKMPDWLEQWLGQTCYERMQTKTLPFDEGEMTREAIAFWLTAYEETENGQIPNLTDISGNDRPFSLEADLHHRVKLEAQRRKISHLHPKKMNTVGTCALYHWLLRHGVTPPAGTPLSS